MSFSARYPLLQIFAPSRRGVRILLAIAIFSLPVSLSAQTTTKQTTKPSRSSISGRVTIKDKGAAGVVIALQKTEAPSPLEVNPRGTTDLDGYYRINNVPPGSYYVSPSTPAYVAAGAKETKNKTVIVGEDDNVEDIDFSLVRGGVITGRVTDADGHPVIQQEVTVYLANAFDQATPERPAVRVGAAATDDRGIYRVYGLAPGRYKVAAGRSDTIVSYSGYGRTNYRQVFHPDVTDQAKATIIETDEGTEATNVDIALGRAMQTFTVSGRIVDGEKGTPVPGVRVGVQRNLGQRFEFMNTFAGSNAQGDFIIEGLIPGKYTVFLLQNQGDMRVESLTFEVIDQDVTGLTVRLTKGAAVSGIVAFESQDKAALAKLSELQVRGYVANPSGVIAMGSSARSPIGADGSFHMSGLPAGTINFTVGSLNNPYPLKGISIVRIEREGTPVGRGVELKDGEQVSGLRLVLTIGNASLRGLVKVENGTLPEGMRIFVRVNRLGETYTLAGAVVDARGRFLMEGLPAGTYELFAMAGGRVVKREITLPENVVFDVTLTIDMSTPPARKL